MRLFGRQPAPAQVPRPPGAAAQVAQVRAVDEEHYADAGFARVAGSAVYRRALLPGAWLVVLDDLTSRDPVRRAYVGVGVHDEALQRALARLVPGGRYTAAVASVQSALPLAEDTSPDRLAQRSVLLYGPGDGRLREQERVRSVVATAQRRYGGLRDLDEVRSVVAASAAEKRPGSLEDVVKAALAGRGQARGQALERLDPELRGAVEAAAGDL